MEERKKFLCRALRVKDDSLFPPTPVPIPEHRLHCMIDAPASTVKLRTIVSCKLRHSTYSHAPGCAAGCSSGQSLFKQGSHPPHFRQLEASLHAATHQAVQQSSLLPRSEPAQAGLQGLRKVSQQGGVRLVLQQRQPFKQQQAGGGAKRSAAHGAAGLGHLGC